LRPWRRPLDCQSAPADSLHQTVFEGFRLSASHDGLKGLLIMKTNCACIAAFFCLACVSNPAAAQNKPGAPRDLSQFHSIKEIIDLIAKQTLLQLKVPVKSEAARAVANEILARKAVNTRVTFKVRVETWQPWSSPGNPDKFTITAPSQTMNFSGVAMNIQTWMSVPPEGEIGLAGLQKGRDATVTGEIGRAQISNNPSEGLVFHLSLRHSLVGGR
jgi:hypothetical protein